MRKEFGKWIVELAEKDATVYLITGDIGYGIFDEFREKFPNRFINLGICEQSMIGVAAGFALEGLKPYVYTITPFLVERPFEQIKLDVDQQNVNVKLVGYADYPTQGPTHAELNWENLSKEFSHIVSYFPRNSQETQQALIESYQHGKPTFISLKKEGANKESQKATEIDSHKLMYHPARVADWNNRGDCYPVYVEIGLTNICNHGCIFCGLDWARGKETLNTQILEKNLLDMASHGVKSVCFSGAGEPTLHPDFSYLVKKTKELGMDVSFSTNAVLFDEEKVRECLPHTSWIRFSVDASSPETHSKIHGTSKEDFQKILNNLSRAVQVKKENNYDIILGVQFLLLEENAHEVLDFTKLMKQIGVDNVQIKPYSQNPNSMNKFYVNYEKFQKLESELNALETDDFKVIFRVKRMGRVSGEHDYKMCYGLPFFTIINAKGEIVPCHLYYNSLDFVFGNINDQLFSTIWDSEKRGQILEKIKQKGVEGCKKGCRIDLINSYLHRLKTPQPHDNFI